jgi:hypothetical protein
MEKQKFDEIVSEQLDRCRYVLLSKSKEYSNDYDKLHNFRIAADYLIFSDLGFQQLK